MVSPPLIIVVLIAAADARVDAVEAMTRTTEEALGPESIVVSREVSAMPDDAGAIAVGDALHASVVVEVTWPDPDRHRAHVHLHASSSSWTDRDLVFVAGDAEVERGRTLGFALASMIPAPPPNVEPPPPPTVISTTRAPAPQVDAKTTTGAAIDRDRRSRFSIEAVALASAGVGGRATAFGGELAARLRLAPRIGFRLGGGARVGDVPGASATTTIYRVDAGLFFELFGAEAQRPFALGARIDVVALRHELAHTGDDGVVAHEGRFIPGMDAVIEGSWSLGAETSVVFGTGVEVAFGTTRVVVHDSTASSIPPLRLIAELGLRAKF